MKRRLFHGGAAADRVPLPRQTLANSDFNSICKEGRVKEAFDEIGRNFGCTDYHVFASLLVACGASKALPEGRQLHCRILKKGFNEHAFVAVQLVNMYGNCGLPQEARQVFDEIPFRTRLLWNAILRNYARNGAYREILKLYHRMREEGMNPDHFTYPLVLKACTGMSDLEEGIRVHQDAVQEGHGRDMYIGAALIDMYSKCGDIEIARQVFDDMPRKDVVAWNSIISGYCRFGNIDFARQLFDQMPRKSVISWTSMIGGYVQNGLFKEALQVFDEMQKDSSILPNKITFVNVLPACAQLSALQRGRAIHDQIIRFGLNSDVSVVTALIDMYVKCGRIQIAKELFENLSSKDSIAWNAMIAGYAAHGHGGSAIGLFERMIERGVAPDEVSFVGVLSACNHAGMVDKGLKFFNSMCNDYGIVPQMEHYACVVDLLGRAGRLDEAHKVIAQIPSDPSPSVWGAMLSACRTHGNVELGEYAGNMLFQLEPYNAGNYVLLSNIYADAGMWDHVTMIRRMMTERGLKKNPGCSWIEIDNTVHAFFGGDKRHPRSQEIYALLDHFSRQMKEEGISSDTSFSLHDVAEEEKVSALWSHSERLAVALGILSTPPGTTIQISKNLRACGDCHTVIKFISKSVQREIIVRDITRFHHFQNGTCSCGDYW